MVTPASRRSSRRKGLGGRKRKKGKKKKEGEKKAFNELY